MGQLDTNKDQIVRAIESLNRLAIALNKQKPAHRRWRSDELPQRAGLDQRQRDDLVKMLQALDRPQRRSAPASSRQSKTATIDSLRALAPTLTKLAEAGTRCPRRCRSS